MRGFVLIAVIGSLGDATPDPGAAAFARGVDALAGDPARAEAEFTRCLDDRAAPPERRARALYNRGTARAMALDTSAGLAAACDDLRACLASPDSPGELRADARNNLEVAKLLLAEARARDARSARAPAGSGPDRARDAEPSPEAESPPESALAPGPASPPATAPGEPGDGGGEPGAGTRTPSPPAADPPPVGAAAARDALAEARARVSRGRAAAAKLRAAGGDHALDW